MPEHNCREHVIACRDESYEPHGEHFVETWWECAICGLNYDASELTC